MTYPKHDPCLMGPMSAPRGSQLPSILCAVAALLLWHADAHAGESGQDPDYQPGYGWLIPGTGVKVGGYTTASYEDIQGKGTNYGIDDLSLFLHWESTGKLRLFSESEHRGSGSSTRPVRPPSKGIPISISSWLYGDYLVFRQAEFPLRQVPDAHRPLERHPCRPAGLDHIAPRSSPRRPFRPMPRAGWSTARCQIFGKLHRLFRVHRARQGLATGPETGSLHRSLRDACDRAVVRLFGARGIPRQFRAGIRDQRAPEPGHGMDYFLVARPLRDQCRGCAYRFSDLGGTLYDEKRPVCPGRSAPLSEQFYAVGRYEFFDPAGPAPGIDVWLLGLAMKPSPAFVLKMEVRDSSKHQTVAPPGVLASVSFLV